MFPRAFSMMSRVTWSMSCSRTKSGAASWMVTLFLLDPDVAVTVQRTSVARLDDRRGVVLNHDGGTRYLVAGAEPAPVVDCGLSPPAVEVHLVSMIYRDRGVRAGPILALLKGNAL